jgi:hypothetical protein
MSETPSPINKNVLSRATLVALGLATFGVVLFIGLWVVLGNVGVEQFARLLMSLCIPPAAIAAIVGIYFLARPNNPD